MRKLVPLAYTLPMAIVLIGVLVYPFLNMTYQGAQPSIDIMEVGSAEDYARLQEIPGWKKLTFENYVSIFTHRRFREALLLSIALSVTISFLSVALCIGPAWLLVRKEFRGKTLLRALLTVPMAFSGIIIGFLAVIMIGRIGIVPVFSDWLIGVPIAEALAYSLIGLGFAYIWFQIPRATLNLESAIRKFDWDLNAAARSLGASPWQAFRYVLLPLLTPAIVSTMAVTFAVSMGSFGVALLLLKKASILPLEIYTQMYADVKFELAAALSVVLAVITVGVNYALRRYGERHYAFANR